MIQKTISQLFLGAFMVAAFTSCSSAYQITGKSDINSLDGKKLYLKTLSESGWTPVDSASVEHGLFSMEGVSDSTIMVSLYMDDESIMPLILENGFIQVSITTGETRASGTPLNNALYNFFDRRNDLVQQMDNLDHREAQLVLNGANIDEVHAQIQRESEDLSRKMNDFIISFIKDNYNNVLGPSVFMMMCSSMPYPMMTDQVEDIMRSAPAMFKQHPMVQEFIAKAQENMKLIEEQQRLQQNIAEKERAAINAANQ
ncbi:MAG: DUF4369 domain-containing protein [Bacteroidaceae bacterium]|jgi:hypothetical protein|nr:DUF4369 domain-containing protein [Bacteroidaceae bacterium]